MKKTILTLFALAALASAATSRARIGETLEEATKRYGAPVFTKMEWFYFLKDGFEIHTHFHRGTVDIIEYVKLPEGNPGGSVELLDREVDTFLAANHGGRWYFGNHQNGYRSWVSSGLFAVQNYYTPVPEIVGTNPASYYRLAICTADAMQRYEAVMDEAVQDEGLKGF